MGELQDRQKRAWEQLKGKYSLDLERVNYALSADGTEIIPVAVRLE